MNSVVLSDAVQASFMLFGFLAIATAVTLRYGTIEQLTPVDCPSLGYVNETHKAFLREMEHFDEAPMRCANPPPASATECVAFGCIAAARPEFLEAPGLKAEAMYFWFIFNMLLFPLNPHMVQRGFLAASDRTLRLVIICGCFAGFVTMLPGIMTGVVTATFRDSWPISSSDATAFSALTNEMK